MGFSRYNRDRPFLIISHSAVPSEGQITSLKNWGENGKWNVNESITVVDRVTDKHITSSSVIVDILKRDLVKNRFAEEYSDEDVIKHYLGKYSKEITEGVDIWMKNRSAGNVEGTIKLISELEDELAKIEVEVENEK